MKEKLSAQAVDPEDFILVTSWENLAQKLGEPFQYEATEGVVGRFRRRDFRPGTIFLSGYSDLCLVLQKDHHPNADLGKLVMTVPWAELARQHSQQYVQVPIGPAVAAGECWPTDTYSLKTERWTWRTFPDIPEQVAHWYLPNLGVDHPRTSLLPFGCNDHGPGTGLLPSFQSDQAKSGWLYVNLQDNTLERITLKKFYQQKDWATVRERANLPVQTYLEELSQHRFCLCACGNGFDTYRVWESLYLGVIPIVSDGIWGRHLARTGLPLVLVKNLLLQELSELGKIYDAYRNRLWSYDAARLSFWEKELVKHAENLPGLSSSHF